MEKSLQLMQVVLRETLVGVFCNRIEPEEDLEINSFLLKLKENKVFNRDDLDRIRHKETYTEKMDEVIETLCLKPESSYVCFMDILRQERMDLYRKVKEIQDKYNYEPSKKLAIF